jgi:heme exporter protein A
MLTVSQITCVRGHRPLFAPASFTLSPGQALHVLGDNGVGKTSLLRIVCGLSPAHSGEVLWQGQPTQPSSAAFHSNLFYLGHGLSLKEELTAVENLMADAAVAGRALSVTHTLDALARMGLKGREHLPLRVMSQGQKRRVALARLLVSQAKLWVLDEPFVALDARAVDHLRGLLGDHVSAGGMVLFTSHQAVALSSRGQDLPVTNYRLELAA